MEPFANTGGSVFTENSKLYTPSINPGVRIYGERLVRTDDIEYREWNPNRSKLAAYLKAGGRNFPIRKNSNVLYLGASSGTTASHISDIVTNGKIYCVEFAPRMFRDLVNTCTGRPNMIPILGDALNPAGYSFAIGEVDVVYSDVAQKRQVDIIADNIETFNAKSGMIAIKARSEDVTADPAEVFRSSEGRLTDRGFNILSALELEPFEHAHEMIVFDH
ncbi:MAG: fibrillarin-like rRNA/tRNA 2'-O-methyltransferase [Candidatus Methanoplasma sp.]|jgi:fibrillarin-like pre-rRNA processing protein|nr:fibrillarin-like rRNA/tRNA 2'-O-methyltransferase [Candidatus Methanoplasma sp.]